MLRQLQVDRNGIAVTGQMLAAAFAFKVGSGNAYLAGALVVGLISFPAWMLALKRKRSISDTPTSRVASAAQGYVELQGRGRALEGMPLLSPVTGLPCLWYRYRIERREGDKWVHDGADESDASFILDDGSGQCLVDPEGAEILAHRHDTWKSGNRRYQQWLLLDKDPLYALGNFVTRGSVEASSSVSTDVANLLAEWKRDRPALLRRFDLDRDGEIDLEEWELARSQARREVLAAQRGARQQAEAHCMGRPSGGRLYLISSLSPERIARRYALWAWAHLAGFFLALAGAAYGWTLPS